MTNILDPKNLNEAMRFSEMISKSNLVPVAFKNKKEDCLIAIQWGYELGLKPLQSLQNLSVINGRPSIWGDAMISLVKADPRCLGVSETVEGEGDEMVARCTVKRLFSGKEVETTIRTFSVADAKQAGLWGKNTWKSYPKRMLQMRARGFALRDAFPDTLRGVISAEEAQDYPKASATKQMLNITPDAQDVHKLDQISGDIEAMIQDCKTIDDLKILWDKLNKSEKDLYLEAKNLKKREFKNV